MPHHRSPSTPLRPLHPQQTAIHSVHATPTAPRRHHVLSTEPRRPPASRAMQKDDRPKAGSQDSHTSLKWPAGADLPRAVTACGGPSGGESHRGRRHCRSEREVRPGKGHGCDRRVIQVGQDVRKDERPMAGSQDGHRRQTGLT